ncbi:MAG: multicopper oxidase family protein [Cytophagales bacterium]|nr:multicopper oxidase family protein [Cytophagales bacterium]
MKKTTLYYGILALIVLGCQPEKQEELPETQDRPDKTQVLNAIREIKPLFQKRQLLKSTQSNSDVTQGDLIFQPFQNPPEDTTINGRLETELNLRFATNQMYNTVQESNVDIYHRSYNDQLVGRTWRIKPGDFLSVDVNNQLANDVCDSDPLNPNPHTGHDINVIDTARFNTTNLHVHGFHVSPSDHADNVFVEIEPGCEFQNRYDIPTDHAPGTFWYHGHVHGSTAIQVSSGMAGAIIIEGGLDNVPEISAMEEKIFVLQQMPYLYDSAAGRYHIPWNNTTFGPNAWSNNYEAQGWRTTINGQSIPVIDMAPEEVQRWRFVHAGVRETINLELFDQDGNTSELLSQDLHTIAEDGIAYGYINEVQSMELEPGYRVDMMVKAPNKLSDTLYLMDTGTEVLGSLDESPSTEDPKLLAMIVLTDKSGTVAKEMPSSESLASLAPYPSLVDVAPTAALENMEFYIDTDVNPIQFQIDRQAFEPSNIRYLTLNKVQDWDLTSGLANHPFHIHINHFQILEKSVCLDWNSDNNTCNEWGSPTKFDQPIWKDTYFVKAREKTRIRTVYKDFTGKFVIHCHILDHEDQGMMQSVEILEEGQEVSQVNFPEITICDENAQLAALEP